MLSVLFFARLRERLGCERLTVDAADDVGALVRRLAAERGADWASALAEDEVVVAVNQVVAGPETRLAPGDEVAFFPPTTGG